MRNLLDELKSYRYAIFYIISVVFIALLPTISDHINPAKRSTEANNTITGKHLTLTTLEQAEQGEIAEPSQTFTPAVQATASHAGSTNSASAYTLASATPVVSGTAITINGRTLGITDVGNTLVDSGDQVNRIGHLLYGHNYSSVFGDIASTGSFTISENGNATTYSVQNVVTLTKEETARYMNALVNGAYQGGRYTYILMTCAGQLYGGGDASHRTIVFAN